MLAMCTHECKETAMCTQIDKIIFFTSLGRERSDAQTVDVDLDPFLDVECRLTIVQCTRVLNIPVTHVVIRHH